MKQILCKWILMGMVFLCPVLLQAQEAKHKVGISFSGGGALGYAHLGVLQALEDYGIEPTIVSGTSMGAIIGVLYAAGYTPQEIMQQVGKYKMSKNSHVLPLDMRAGELGLCSKKHIASFLQKVLPTNNFDSLPKPFYCAVTNLTTCHEEIAYRGPNLQKYILASMAIPVLFHSVTIDSMVYVDGGVTNNLPANAIRNECAILIGVDVNPFTPCKHLKSIKDATLRTMQTLVMHTSHTGRACCDYVIEVPANHKYGILDFGKYKEIYKIGYESGLHFLLHHPELLQLSSDLTPEKHTQYHTLTTN